MAPIIVDGPEEIFNEAPVVVEPEPLVADESEPLDVSPEPANSPEIPVEEKSVDSFEPPKSQPPQSDIKSSESQPSQEKSEPSINKVSPIGSQKKSGLNVGDNRNALKIIIALVGASAALMLFWFGRRH